MVNLLEDEFAKFVSHQVLPMPSLPCPPSSPLMPTFLSRHAPKSLPPLALPLLSSLFSPSPPTWHPPPPRFPVPTSSASAHGRGDLRSVLVAKMSTNHISVISAQVVAIVAGVILLWCAFKKGKTARTARSTEPLAFSDSSAPNTPESVQVRTSQHTHAVSSLLLFCVFSPPPLFFSACLR